MVDVPAAASVKPDERALRILAFAYACEPSEGSEPGTGWMWSRLLARLGPTTVVTRGNNRDAIEQALPTTPEADRLQFMYVELPHWARRWKKGKRGARIYYMLWQYAALRNARTASRGSGWDVVWHVTFSNFWLGSVGGNLGIPFVLGPVGGGVPSSFNVRIVGTRGLVYEAARSIGRVLGRWANPLARVAWGRAALILVNNRETKDALPRRHRMKSVVFPHMMLETVPERRSSTPPEPKTALFASRLIGWKGGALAIRALARLPGWVLLVCGKGPDERRLRHLAHRLGVDDRIDFLGWTSRVEVHRLMRERAHVFVFPGVHEDGGWAGCEAAAHGLPVICVDRGGPPLVSGTVSVKLGSVSDTARRLADAMANARRGGESNAWSIDVREEHLRTLLAHVGLSHVIRQQSV